MMLVWDMVASYGLTPFRSDFIDYVECDIPVKDVTKVNRFIGIGTTLHKIIESNGQDILFTFISFHLTQTDVRLFSPQTYEQMHGSHSLVHGNQVTINFPFHRIHIPVDIVRTDLPVLHHSFVTRHQKRAIGNHMILSLDYSRLLKLDFFGNLNTIRSLQDMDISIEQTKIEP